MPKYIAFLYFFLCFGFLRAQNTPLSNAKIYLHYYDLSTDLVTPLYRDTNFYLDSTKIAFAQAQFLQDYYKKGFVFASIDSIAKENQDSIAIWKHFVYLGNVYHWEAINIGNVPKDWLAATGIQFNKIKGKTLQTSDLEQLYKGILAFAENNGYPFATIQLKDFSVQANKISATLYLDKGELMKMDKIHLEKIEPDPNIPNSKDPTLKLRKGYLTHYLGIRKGMPYNEKNIQKMQTRLNALNFVQVHKSPYVVFIDDKVESYFYLKSKQANRFDFLIGIQPNDNLTNPATQAQARRVSITGNATIDLRNAFALGERLMFSWQRLQTQTSDLQIHSSFPYIFDLPIGTDFTFKIYRKDTAYVDVIADIGFQYLLLGGNYFKVFWKHHTTNINTIDTATIRRTQRLPSNLDLKVNAVGMEYYYQQLDYRFNPRKGIEILSNFSAGIKKYKPNIAILSLSNEDFDFGTLYDSLQNAYQIKWQNSIAYYLPLGKSATLLSRIQSAYFWSNTSIFNNELYRIGGSKIQRGFDEEILPASSYATFTLEGRYLFNMNSYFFAFTDLSFVERKSALEPRQRTIPYSFGVGLALQTKVGVFGLSYALGTRIGENLQFKNAKIHFGYVNNF